MLDKIAALPETLSEVETLSGDNGLFGEANDTEYGLSSAVFGRDIKRAMAVAKRIEAGICHINGPTAFDEAQMPFRGVKASGYGRLNARTGRCFLRMPGIISF